MTGRRRKPPLKVQVVLWHKPAGSRPPRFLMFHATAERGGFWQPVTGSCEQGETLAQAARREAAEETSWADLGEPVALNYVHRFPMAPHKRDWYEPGATELEEHAFAIEVAREAQPRLDPHEHCEARWVDLETALGLCRFEPNREALRRAAKAISKR